MINNLLLKKVICLPIGTYSRDGALRASTVKTAVFDVEPGSVKVSVSVTAKSVPPETKVKVGFPLPSVVAVNVAFIPTPSVLVGAKGVL